MPTNLTPHSSNPALWRKVAQAGAQLAQLTVNPDERQRLTDTNLSPISGKDTVEEAKPMTITLSDNLSQASSNQNTATLDIKSNQKPHSDGQNFGQFMSEMFLVKTETPAATTQDKAELAELQGQEIAATVTTAEQTAALQSTWPLKAVTLGPHLSVITPETSPPDSQSLAAFARAQGLDETAVRWLFGGQESAMPVAALPTPLGISSATTGSAAGLLASMTATPNIAQGGPNPDPANSTPNGQTQGSNTGLLGSALAGAQSLWAMADAPKQTYKIKEIAITSTEEALPIQMLRMPPPAAVWMQRGAMNNMLQSSVSAQKEAAISLSELDLGAEWGEDALQQLLGTEGGTSGASSTGTHGTAYANFASRWDAQASNRNDLSNTNIPAPDLPDIHARNENIQHLADKMGQAVGQRILSEMEKGQWHLKLQLRPATLGHIEVEMRMRSGEFDAVFIAPNSTTRDLLQDGMGKLRETLAHMGMDVANIHVGNGQTGQGGGDSTPGTPQGKTESVKASTPERSVETLSAPRVKDPNDGLDVLV